MSIIKFTALNKFDLLEFWTFLILDLTSDNSVFILVALDRNGLWFKSTGRLVVWIDTYIFGSFSQLEAY